MTYRAKTTTMLSVSAAFGAMVAGLAVYAITSREQYHGIPAPRFDPTYFFNNGTVGPFQTYSGVWIDGFEESRFFPNMRSLAVDPIPETTSRLQMDDVSRNLVHRFMAKPLERGCIDVFAISFKGNAVKPDHAFGMPGYIEMIYVPTEMLTVTPLRRVC